MSAATIRAEGLVPSTRDALFARLCDLDGHRGLAAPHIAILRLRGPRGARTGGDVELRGPLGVRLRATTAVRTVLLPRELSGTATTARGTTATLCWRLDEVARAQTRVTAVMTVQPRGAVDRLLLRAGGARWLHRRLVTAIGRLAAAETSRGEVRPRPLRATRAQA